MKSSEDIIILRNLIFKHLKSKLSYDDFISVILPLDRIEDEIISLKIKNNKFENAIWKISNTIGRI